MKIGVLPVLCTLLLPFTSSSDNTSNNNDYDDANDKEPIESQSQSESQSPPDLEKLTNEFLSRHIIPSTPEDVGIGHTSVIQNLNLRIEQILPNTRTEYLRQVSLAMSEHICHPFDFECNRNVMKRTSTLHLDYKVSPEMSMLEHVTQNVLPTDFDPKAKEYLTQLYQHISRIDLNEDPTPILHQMNLDLQELKYNDEIENEQHRLVGSVAYSVGMESAKQWHEIFNDPTNAFYRFVIAQKHQRQNKNKNEKQRNLQLDSLINLGLDLAGGAGGEIGDITDLLALATGNADTFIPDPLLPNTEVDLDIDFNELLEMDVTGAATGVIETGFATVTGGQTSVLTNVLAEAALASAIQIVEDLTLGPEDEEANEDCLFDGTELCNEENFTPGGPDNPQNCPFPDSPFCNTTTPNPGDAVTVNGCLYPNSPWCSHNSNPP